MFDTILEHGTDKKIIMSIGNIQRSWGSIKAQIKYLKDIILSKIDSIQDPEDKFMVDKIEVTKEDA